MPATWTIGGRLAAVLRSLGDAPVPFDVAGWRPAFPLGPCYVSVAWGRWRETGLTAVALARAPLDGAEATVDVIPPAEANDLISALVDVCGEALAYGRTAASAAPPVQP